MLKRSPFSSADEEPCDKRRKAIVQDPSTPVSCPKVSPATADDLNTLLSCVPTFCLLTPDLVQSAGIERAVYSPDQIIAQHTEPILHVFVLIEGEVEVFSEGDSRDPLLERKRAGQIVAPAYFGDLPAVVGQCPPLIWTSGSAECTILRMEVEPFLALLGKSTAFAQSVGRKLHEKANLFSNFRSFCKTVFDHDTVREFLDVGSMVAAFKTLSPSIHPKMLERELDVGAWTYAIRRLPKNLTTSLIYDLARSLPPFCSQYMRDMLRDPTIDSGVWDLHLVETQDRRRRAFQMGLQGKTLVLLRDGFSDLLDLCTCFCIHLIESRKFRHRLTSMLDPTIFVVVDEARKHCDAPDLAEKVLRQLPVSKTEYEGLLRLWPDGKDLLTQLTNIVMHHEEYQLRVDTSISVSFDINPHHAWIMNIRAQTLNILNLNPCDAMPDNLVVDLISSNTHSVRNCLSGLPRKHYQSILEFGREHFPAITAENWTNESDLVYVLLPRYLNHSKSQLRTEWAAADVESGILHIRDAEITGLEVTLVNVSQLLANKVAVDSVLSSQGLPADQSLGPRIIVNIDYAFGAQADGILRSLALLFGHRVRSVNVLGKAGGLEGARGDIQLASHVLFSKSSTLAADLTDELRHCGNEDVSAARLTELSSRKVWHGRVMTIAGTLLQNAKLLNFYKRIWQCVGLEMEGSWYMRQVEECKALGILKHDLKTRVAYYTSDLPLDVGGASLAKSMGLSEGVTPLYAITRHFLELILGQDKK
eukprot:NODE_437_length_2482_cov_57.512081_g415_i0.p1 GENE.NODE_437_length_2482_cov_57.512081_g415_i0~~NODE_437_length_2482_cov_57.512081_g415_i0.p1  ORF type:complete len:759 (-),score=144.36 NODE_437_length_2482_cov_57.512081_g415_i0:130-2406(-)